MITTPIATIPSTPSAGSGTSQDTAVRRSGAALGIIVFLVGIALVGYVFVTARDLFNQAPPQLPVAPAPAASPAPNGAAPTADTAKTAAAAGEFALGFVRQVGVLLLMCIAGSVIASRGIELFFKACAAAPPSVRPARAVAPPAPAPETAESA